MNALREWRDISALRRGGIGAHGREIGIHTENRAFLQPPFAGRMPADVAERVHAIMRPLYIVAREREIHADAVAGLLGSRSGIPARAG